MRSSWHGDYLTERDAPAPLSPKEEAELARRYREEGDQRAADRIIRSYQRFVFKVAHQFRQRGPRFEDLVQEGNVGLLLALQRFEPERGNRFGTYAIHWIRAQMQAYVLAQHSLVRLGTSQVQRKLFYRMAREQRALEAEGLDGPDRDERIAERVGVSPKSVTEMRKRLSGPDMSLDAPLRGDDTRTIADAVEDPGEDPEATCLRRGTARHMRTRLESAFDAVLDDRERYILDLRLRQEKRWTLEAIGDTLGITRERTRQLEARAKGKLQQELADLMAVG